MIKYAKEKGIVDVHFHSHGGLLTEKKSIELIESGLDKLLISVDTPNKQKYEKLRVLSKFDSVISNLKKLKYIITSGMRNKAIDLNAAKKSLKKLQSTIDEAQITGQKDEGYSEWLEKQIGKYKE